MAFLDLHELISSEVEKWVSKLTTSNQFYQSNMFRNHILDMFKAHFRAVHTPITNLLENWQKDTFHQLHSTFSWTLIKYHWTEYIFIIFSLKETLAATRYHRKNTCSQKTHFHHLSKSAKKLQITRPCLCWFIIQTTSWAHSSIVSPPVEASCPTVFPRCHQWQSVVEVFSSCCKPNHLHHSSLGGF